MPETAVTLVPDDLVDAALAAAAALGRAVRDVSVAEIARYAGISRATLLRRLGGTRVPLDDAVRARGVDPGGRSVRERGLEAAGMVLSDRGLAATTMDAIAVRAGCSVDSLYATFGSRDELLAAAFEEYTPVGLLTEVLLDRPDDLLGSVEQLYGWIAEVLTAEPRLVPAMMAEVLARADGPAIEAIAEMIAPHMYAGVGRWLRGLVLAGRIRDIPLLTLSHQLVGPITFHLLVRPTFPEDPAMPPPDVTVACADFAESFVRAVATDPEAELAGRTGPAAGSPHR